MGDPRNETAGRRCVGGRFSVRCLTLVLALWFSLPTVLDAFAEGPEGSSAGLPDAPQAQSASKPAPVPGPCRLRDEGATVAGSAAAHAASIAGFGEVDDALNSGGRFVKAPCPVYVPFINWYARFLNGPQVKPLTPKEKAWLAIRNVGDPFNGITILGTSAISVGSDSHSPYGPGMPGFARNVGVSYAQDMTGEFFGTFLIPSIAHQDPHYHRAPGLSIPRRVLHAIVQVGWTQGDNGRGMLNYADLVGFAIDDEVSNLYVPGRQTDLPASAARYATTLALAPTDNFITEFLPDLARRIHVQVVIVQRIIDQVAKTEPGGASP